MNFYEKFFSLTDFHYKIFFARVTVSMQHQKDSLLQSMKTHIAWNVLGSKAKKILQPCPWLVNFLFPRFWRNLSTFLSNILLITLMILGLQFMRLADNSKNNSLTFNDLRDPEIFAREEICNVIHPIGSHEKIFEIEKFFHNFCWHQYSKSKTRKIKKINKFEIGWSKFKFFAK